MKKDAYIKIISTQTTEEGTDKGEIQLLGTISHKDGKSVIEYTEISEEMGSEKMTLTVKEDCVSIVREGQFSSEMSVEQGVRHLTFYKTPYGEFTIGVYGKAVSWFRNGAKSVLKMKYTLDFNNGYISETEMKIFIEEKNDVKNS